ncbi:dentin sialophosphoprotein-like [Echeneis naucrates]|uniref:dentin sialophosphoprotein-like n=1 Tax=Echeneis naucrates TaxID=173247 RepID=UPI0011139202|nr:dentin sialophosphoprotein-like [Echeneis naucrates]
MKITVVIFCLIGAILANPISLNVLLKSNELDANTTESLSVSQSSENSTSELQSSEEIDSNQSSESESSESTSEEKTSEESNSQSDEDDGTDLMAETRDNSMGSEENVRKSLVQVYASIIQNVSAEDYSTEVKSQTDDLSEELQQPPHTSVKQKTNGSQSQTTLLLMKSPTDSSDTSSESSETSDMTAMTTATTDSTSSESNETSDSSDSSDASKSTEDSDASDSTEQQQIKINDCVNGTESCESEEDFFQAVGDDPHYYVDNLMVPDEDERELSLRR